jgi:hypothetical protein
MADREVGDKKTRLAEMLEKGLSSGNPREEDMRALEDELNTTPFYTADDLPREPQQFYVHNDEEVRKGFSKKVRELWETYKPQTAFDYSLAGVSLVTMPVGVSSYALWKMPLETHEKVNSVLGYTGLILGSITGVAAVAGAEPVALVTGIGAAVAGLGLAASQIVYGFKQKSGKHAVSGLEGVVANAKKIAATTNNLALRQQALAAQKNADEALLVFAKASGAKNYSPGKFMPASKGLSTRVGLN